MTRLQSGPWVSAGAAPLSRSVPTGRIVAVGLRSRDEVAVVAYQSPGPQRADNAGRPLPRAPCGYPEAGSWCCRPAAPECRSVDDVRDEFTFDPLYGRPDGFN